MSEKRATKSNMYCCVPQCSTYYDGTVSFHIFPTYNQKLKAEWIRVLKIGKEVSPFMRVCSKHFKDEDFFFKAHVNKLPRLKKNVMPSQNLPKLTHERPVNEVLVNQRNERIRNRSQKLIKLPFVTDVEENLQVANNLTNEGENDEETSVEATAAEAAEILLSLKDAQCHVPPSCCEKTFEDKGVQVNTYEEFNTFDLGDMVDSNHKLRMLTGISNFALLNALVVALSTFKVKSKLDVKKRLLLTLMRIKLDLTFTALAVFFNISSSTANTYFQTTIQHLASVLSCVIRFPPKEEILNNLPLCFQKFRHTRIVLDCTEIEVQKSKCLNCRVRTYSFYKGRHTIKFLIGVAPSGPITYLSKAYGGRASDKAIFNNENMISLFKYPDAIMVDKGFLIEKECSENLIKLIRPPFLKKKKQLSPGETVKMLK